MVLSRSRGPTELHSDSHLIAILSVFCLIVFALCRIQISKTPAAAHLLVPTVLPPSLPHSLTPILNLRITRDLTRDGCAKIHFASREALETRAGSTECATETIGWRTEFTNQSEAAHRTSCAAHRKLSGCEGAQRTGRATGGRKSTVISAS
jgi:hypothetical protein